MDHVLREGLYMDRIRTYLASWNKGSELYVHFQGKCIEIHVGYGTFLVTRGKQVW